MDLLLAVCPSCHSTISVNALIETQSTYLTNGLASSFLHPQPDS